MYAIVVSRFNEEVTQELLNGALARFEEHGIARNAIKVVEVPGAIEIPLVAQTLAQQKKFAAIVCLGAVIRGETTHYDYVCQQVSWGCQHIALTHNLPVIFGILTTENEEQAFDRLGGNHGHKGRDAADTAITMAKIQQELTAC